MIFLASDHGGFELKKTLTEYLKKSGIQYEDLGPYSFDKDDDYPDYAKSLVSKMEEIPDSRGILICRNGVGVTIAANRYQSIRAGLSWNAKHAVSSRKDDDTNVLTLPADYISSGEAVEILEAWLNTPFNNEERFERRISKLA